MMIEQLALNLAQMLPPADMVTAIVVIAFFLHVAQPEDRVQGLEAVVDTVIDVVVDTVGIAADIVADVVTVVAGIVADTVAGIVAGIVDIVGIVVAGSMVDTIPEEEVVVDIDVFGTPVAVIALVDEKLCKPRNLHAILL